MSEDILFEAMGGIDGEYVLSAARRLGLLAPVGKKPRRALRRTLIGLAAAAALLVLGGASFSVVGALAMLIAERRGEIATLRALGADTRLVRRIFRTEGLLICTAGALAGVVLGVGACLVQQHFGLIEIPAESFLTKSYPVEFRPGDLAAVLAAFAAVALLLTGLTVRGMIKRYD